MSKIRTIQLDPNVKRQRGGQRRNFGDTTWAKIHGTLGEILQACVFKISGKEFIKLEYSGRIDQLRRNTLKLQNLLDSMLDEEGDENDVSFGR